MDRFAAMQVFVRVVEAGSYSKAADSLNLPNATITRLIQRLEAHLQVRLLQRTTRQVTVTPEGANFYERAVKLLAELADMESTARQSLARPSGSVRVETPAAMGSMVIVPALNEFYRAYPDVEIDLRIGNRFSDLVAEGVDCAIRVGEITEQFMVARRIGEFRHVACATPQFLKLHGTPATPADLQARRLTIGLVSTSTGRAIPFRFRNDADEIDISPSHILLVNDTNAYLAAGLAGLGIIQAPDYVVGAAVASGRLVQVLEEWQTPTVPVHVIYPPNRYLSAKVRVFIDWAIELFDRHATLRST